MSLGTPTRFSSSSSPDPMNLTQVGGAAIALGQTTMANSVPVVIASNQTTLPVTIAAGTNVIGHVIVDSGSITANAGTNLNTSALVLDATVTTLDTDVKSNITLHAGTNIIGKVTTDQTTHGTTDLVAADVTKVGGATFALGQQLAAASLPVVLTAAQILTLTPLTSVTATQATGTNLHTVIDSGTVTLSSNVISSKTALTPAAPANASVGVSSAQAVASDSSRKGLILVNTSVNTISLAFGSNAAVLRSGITLYPGGTYEMDEYNYSTQAVNAIASAASSNLSIQAFD